MGEDDDKKNEFIENRFSDPDAFRRGIANVAHQLDLHKDICLPADEFSELSAAAESYGHELGAILSVALSNRPLLVQDEQCIIRILRHGEFNAMREPDC